MLFAANLSPNKPLDLTCGADGRRIVHLSQICRMPSESSKLTPTCVYLQKGDGTEPIIIGRLQASHIEHAKLDLFVTTTDGYSVSCDGDTVVSLTGYHEPAKDESDAINLDDMLGDDSDDGATVDEDRDDDDEDGEDSDELENEIERATLRRVEQSRRVANRTMEITELKSDNEDNDDKVNIEATQHMMRAFDDKNLGFIKRIVNVCPKPKSSPNKQHKDIKRDNGVVSAVGCGAT